LRPFRLAPPVRSRPFRSRPCLVEETARSSFLAPTSFVLGLITRRAQDRAGEVLRPRRVPRPDNLLSGANRRPPRRSAVRSAALDLRAICFRRTISWPTTGPDGGRAIMILRLAVPDGEKTEAQRQRLRTFVHRQHSVRLPHFTTRRSARLWGRHLASRASMGPRERDYGGRHSCARLGFQCRKGTSRKTGLGFPLSAIIQPHDRRESPDPTERGRQGAHAWHLIIAAIVRQFSDSCAARGLTSPWSNWMCSPRSGYLRVFWDERAAPKPGRVFSSRLPGPNPSSWDERTAPHSPLPTAAKPAAPFELEARGRRRRPPDPVRIHARSVALATRPSNGATDSFAP